ncbi:MAG TPA: hypothetical protein GX708_12770, partial [Gallicola sp.]|nr:hypothetical protein [Gallicola sp.]
MNIKFKDIMLFTIHPKSIFVNITTQFSLIFSFLFILSLSSTIFDNSIEAKFEHYNKNTAQIISSHDLHTNNEIIEYLSDYISSQSAVIRAQEIDKIENITSIISTNVRLNNGNFARDVITNFVSKIDDINIKGRYKIIRGNNDFTNDNDIIISKELALEFFNTVDVIGNNLYFSPINDFNLLNEQAIQFNICGVFEGVEVTNSFIPDSVALDQQSIIMQLDNLTRMLTTDDSNSVFRVFSLSLIIHSENPINEELHQFYMKLSNNRDSYTSLYFYKQRNERTIGTIMSIINMVFLFAIIISLINFILVLTLKAIKSKNVVIIRILMGASRKYIMLMYFLSTFAIALFSIIFSFIVTFIYKIILEANSDFILTYFSDIYVISLLFLVIVLLYSIILSITITKNS